jgi:hypothetical protein
MNPNRSLNMKGSGIGNITLSAQKMAHAVQADKADYTIEYKIPF